MFICSFCFISQSLDFQVTTPGDEDGIPLCYTAISCYFLHQMILLHFVSFVCASTHVLVGAFANPTMASPLLESVGEFDPSSESFTAYLERLNQFFAANDIGKCADDATAAVVRAANQKKVAVMISFIGKKIYSTLRDLCSPENPKENTFEALCEQLQQHFKPKRLEVAESYRFHRCCQEQKESVSAYSARLSHLAATCNFWRIPEPLAPRSVCLRDSKPCDSKKNY